MKVYAGRHDFATSPEGEIEIILSQEECDGNWVGLPAGAGYVTIRQYCYDWPNERPARLTLERIGAPYPPPAPTHAYLTERLELLVDFLRDMPTLCAKAVEQYFAAPADSFRFPPSRLILTAGIPINSDFKVCTTARDTSVAEKTRP